MDNHDQLAKLMLESKESLSVRRSSPELNPLEQLLAKVQIRWPFPEMGDLEYCDWRETLNLYPIEETSKALNRLLEQPPRRELPDGSITEYRGRPTLVDVTRTISIMREEAAQEVRKKQAESLKAEMRELEMRRRNGEHFYTLADVLRGHGADPEEAAKQMPQSSAYMPSDAELEQKKRDAAKVAERFK